MLFNVAWHALVERDDATQTSCHSFTLLGLPMSHSHALEIIFLCQVPGKNSSRSAKHTFLFNDENNIFKNYIFKHLTFFVYFSGVAEF